MQNNKKEIIYYSGFSMIPLESVELLKTVTAAK